MRRLGFENLLRSFVFPFLLVGLTSGAAGAGCGKSLPATTTTTTATTASAAQAIQEDDESAPPASDASPKAASKSESPRTGPMADVSTLPSLWTRKKGVDWPCFLGPTRDSKSPETGLVAPWPEQGPRIVWQRKLGEGYGIGSVSGGRFLQFDRERDEAVLWCLNAETGAELWRFAYPTDYADLYQYNGGPRASPVIDGDHVYILGVEGMLHCLRLSDGSVAWKVDTTRDFGVIQNFFGVGSTPVVEGDLLLLIVGGSPPEDKNIPPGQLNLVSGNGSGIVAFDKRTGRVVYKITDELASYASIQLATIGDRRYGFAFCRGGLTAFEPATGKVDFEYPWRAKILESVNASTPVIRGDEVFISETYGVGSSLLRVAAGKHEVVWADDVRKREKSFKAHWNTPIEIDGYLYGCSGRNPPDAEMRCIAWKTSEVQWSELTQIRSSLLYVDGHFISLGETGTLELIKVNPRKYEVTSSVTLKRAESGPALPGFEGANLLRYPCWAAPVLSHGLLYVRGEDRLVCLEVIPE